MHNPLLHSLLSGGLASHPRDSSVWICCVRKRGLEVCSVSPLPTKIKVLEWQVPETRFFFLTTALLIEVSLVRRAAPSTVVSGDMPPSSGRVPCVQSVPGSQEQPPLSFPGWRLPGSEDGWKGSYCLCWNFIFSIVLHPGSRCPDHGEHHLQLGNTRSPFPARLTMFYMHFPCLTRLLNILLPFSIVLHILS